MSAALTPAGISDCAATLVVSEEWLMLSPELSEHPAINSAAAATTGTNRAALFLTVKDMFSLPRIDSVRYALHHN